MILNINNLDIFKDIYLIELNTEPNQTLDIFLNSYNFNIQIRTYVENQTRISILLNNDYIVNNGSVNITNINLNYFSSFNKGCFFFLNNIFENKQDLNYLNFGKGFNLYYGSF